MVCLAQSKVGFADSKQAEVAGAIHSSPLLCALCAGDVQEYN